MHIKNVTTVVIIIIASGQLYEFSGTLPTTPILLDDVICHGNETSLLQCVHAGLHNHDCSYDEAIVLGCWSKRNI